MRRSASGRGPDLTLTKRERDQEKIRCGISPLYFVDRYCWLEDKTARRWIPFELWQCQAEVLKLIIEFDLLVILKAMKLGLTWICIAYALWEMLFRPGGLTLLFSLRDDEAMDLLKRLRGMHTRLPRFLQASLGTDNEHEFEFARLGSKAQAFPCTGTAGRNYTGSLAIIDEADFIGALKQLVAAVLPGVEAGGKLIMVSASNKDMPASEFKRVYRRAVSGENNFKDMFLAWSARPDRDEQWYKTQAADYDEDDLYANYPANPQQALAARSSNKRFKPEWLMGWELVGPVGYPLTVPGLVVFESPHEGERYVVAGDPSEGNPNSHPSAATVLNSKWEQVAVMHGLFEPDVFGGYLVELAKWYNDATIVPERNNHGHAVILAVRNLGAEELLYVNPFDSRPGRKKYGWLSSPRLKSMAVDLAAQTLRDSAGSILRDEATVNEFISIEASTLKAPAGMQDDRAMSMMIGYAALRWPTLGRMDVAVDAYIKADDPLETIDAGGFA